MVIKKEDDKEEFAIVECSSIKYHNFQIVQFEMQYEVEYYYAFYLA